MRESGEGMRERGRKGGRNESGKKMERTEREARRWNHRREI